MLAVIAFVVTKKRKLYDGVEFRPGAMSFEGE